MMSVTNVKPAEAISSSGLMPEGVSASPTSIGLGYGQTESTSPLYPLPYSG
jgi:hypothetical protein